MITKELTIHVSFHAETPEPAMRETVERMVEELRTNIERYAQPAFPTGIKAGVAVLRVEPRS